MKWTIWICNMVYQKILKTVQISWIQNYTDVLYNIDVKDAGKLKLQTQPKEIIEL